MHNPNKTSKATTKYKLFFSHLDADEQQVTVFLFKVLRKIQETANSNILDSKVVEVLVLKCSPL